MEVQHMPVMSGLDRNKIYYMKNKEKFKKYYEMKKDYIKEYRMNNKVKISDYFKKTKFHCDICNSEVLMGSKANHLKSFLHTYNYMRLEYNKMVDSSIPTTN